MKKLFYSSLAAIGMLALLTSPSLAANQEGKEITIKGEGKCAKCLLKETTSCQNVIEVKKHKKTKAYYLVQNEVSKNFHEDLCKEAKKVRATGTVKKVHGKLEFTATKIELVK